MTPVPPSLDDALSNTTWVRRLARSLTSDADADDLAQDAWEAALSVDHPSRGWFAGALRNLAAFHHRTTARRVRRDTAVELPEPEPTPDVVLERIEAQRQLATFVSELPEPTRTVVYLRYFEGLDATAIGETLQLPPGTVRWRLKQGLDTLRARLDAQAGGREHWSAVLLPLAQSKTSPLSLTGVMLMKLKHVAAVALAVVLFIFGGLALRCSPDGTSMAADIGPTPTVVSASSRTAVADVVPATGPLPSWRAQPNAPNRKVAGRVLLDGAPLAGATVTLTMDEQPTDAPPQERITATDGTFDFGVQPAVAVGVGAALKGHAAAIVELDLRNPEARPETLELALTSGCPALLSGRVFDSGAGRIANAVVRPSRAVGVRSDASGAYALCLNRGDAEVLVEASGYGAMRMHLTLDGPYQRDVVLTPEAGIEGVVVDGEARPVADALVTASQRMWQRTDAARPAISRTDALGRFTLAVAPGDYRVQAVAGGTSASPLQMVSALVGEPSHRLTLVVKQGVRVRGVVLSAGTPVAGAKVTAHTVASGRALDAFTQRDGRFVLEGVPAGELVFTAEPWAVDQPRRYFAKADAPDVTLEVNRMAALHGVVTRRGVPVPGANVSAQGAFIDVKTVSDARGRYALEGLGRGGLQVVATSEAQGAYVVKSVSIKGREQLELDLELAGAGFIDGTLVDEKSQPVPSARVEWMSDRQDDWGTSTTDAKGHFHVAKLAGGDGYTPKVYLSGEANTAEAKPANGAFPRVKLADGEAKAEHVRLQVKVEKLTLSGRVVDVQGQPVPDVNVRAKPAGADLTFSPFISTPQSFSDADGRFTFDKLPSGTWALQARSPRGEETIVKAEAGAREVVITLHPTAIVEGKLVGYHNTPVVYANPTQGRFISGQVTGDTFRVVLPAGEWTITAMDNMEGDIKKVVLKEGETREVTLESHGMGKIRGRIVDFETGLPVSNVMCRTLLAAGTSQGVTNWDHASVPMSDEQGLFVFESAPAGHLLVACLGDSTQSGASTFIDLPTGGEKELTLKVVPITRSGTSGHGIELFSPTLSITGVQPGSPAANAGLQPGDLLVSVDGRRVDELGPEGAAVLLDNEAPGSVVPVGVLRGGALLNASLTLP